MSAHRQTAAEKRAQEREHELALAAVTRPRAEPTTDVEVNRSVTNGRFGFKVAVTLPDPDEAYRKASELAEALAQRFPLDDTEKKLAQSVVTIEDAKKRSAQRGAIAASRRKKP